MDNPKRPHPSRRPGAAPAGSPACASERIGKEREHELRWEPKLALNHGWFSLTTTSVQTHLLFSSCSLSRQFVVGTPRVRGERTKTCQIQSSAATSHASRGRIQDPPKRISGAEWQDRPKIDCGSPANPNKPNSARKKI